MELEKVVQQKLDDLVATGKVAEIIEKHITKTIDELMHDLLRGYSDFGKQVKEAIGSKMQLSLDKLNIDCYTQMVCQTIENTLNGTVLEAARKKVQEHVTDVLEVIEKKHWKLSEIVLKFRESLHTDRPQVDIQYKEEGYFNYVRLGERKESRYGSTSTKNIDITLHLRQRENNMVFAVTNHGLQLNPLNDKPNRWEVFMMQLWVNECTIEIDLDDAEYIAENEFD